MVDLIPIAYLIWLFKGIELFIRECHLDQWVALLDKRLKSFFFSFFNKDTL